MLDWFYNINIVDGPLPLVIWAITVAGVVLLLIRRPSRRWLFLAVGSMLTGAALGLAVEIIVDATGVVGVPLPSPTAPWLAALCAAIGLACMNIVRSSRRRKVAAVALIVFSVLSAGLGINAGFGINRTIGSAFGVSTGAAIEGLTRPKQVGPAPVPVVTAPLYESWNPPADMPTTGKTGLLTGADAIASSTAFVPREASIYLPPAAQVANPPALPLVVMMMGQPGNPQPDFIAAALDEVAAKNKGLAPIVIIADQLGDPNTDPVCADSARYGGVDTYFNKDIVAYAKSALHIVQDPRYWTIAGYSNGGACAFTWASKYPEIWGNVVDISGNEWPGDENETAAIADGYGGDADAFAAAKPAAWLEKNAGKFTTHVAIFTAGENDPEYTQFAVNNAALAEAAGFTTKNYVVPGADHVVTALRGGLPHAFTELYPRLGLAAPPSP
ncbi:esterase [Agreia pratensis]|uniref:alpha/beta hydrolase n=1 Tax=Agreia pratensis TaxID=150121 RepID=UPI001889C639|nr:alpha/beta hydrolase-fold protein [Agreia pratensis]MBF4636018.1 esterase [Agreia pratensis]